jgi:drug/metabolite transporter (DMT)-like permease
MRGPIVAGAAYALIAALAFGATTPLIAHAGAGAGPWAVAALLYAGAALAAVPGVRSPDRERRIERRDIARILAAAVIGAMLAPAALVWGLQRTGALSASLALTLESVFTVAIAAAVFHEYIGRRVALAAILIALGAAELALASNAGTFGAVGLLAVAAATLLWAIDNALTGTVADADPSAVVLAKSSVGAAGSAAIAFATAARWPAFDDLLALILIGAIGYGASLRWYLLAQRRFGIARTASVFAAAPFVGAVLAVILGERATSWTIPAAAACIAAGVALHLSEQHQHVHRHRELDHEHAHAHDDGHHAHGHAQPIRGMHSHAHHHAPQLHAHAHAPDVHHVHEHEAASD